MSGLIQLRIQPADLARVREGIIAYGKHGRFALALSLNDSAKAIQTATRAEIDPRLTVRTAQSRRFLELRVMIPRGGWATRDNPHVIIGVMDGDALAGRGKLSLLPALSSGGDVKTMGRWGPLAVPTNVLRPYPRAVIPAAFYPRALRVLERRDVDGGAMKSTVPGRTRGRSKKGAKYGVFGQRAGHIVVKGKSRTFALDPRYHPGLPPNSYGVYQRTGTGKHQLQLLWHYQTRVPVPSRIPFQEIADRVIAREFAAVYEKNLDRALGTAL